MYSQNKGLWDRNNFLCSLAPLSLLRLFSAPPSFAISLALPPSHSHSLSQEDLKYQYPFLLDIAFSLQSAFCCPFIVKTSGEIPCRNILSNAALPASNGQGAALHQPLSDVFWEKRAHAHTHSQCTMHTHKVVLKPGSLCQYFRDDRSPNNELHPPQSHQRGTQYLGNWVSLCFLPLPHTHTHPRSTQAPYS